MPELIKTIRTGNSKPLDDNKIIVVRRTNNNLVLQYGSGDDGGQVYEGLGICRNADGTIDMEIYYEGVGGSVAVGLNIRDIQYMINFMLTGDI